MYLFLLGIIYVIVSSGEKSTNHVTIYLIKKRRDINFIYLYISIY